MELKHLFIFCYGGALATPPKELTMEDARSEAMLHAKSMEDKLHHPEIGITVQVFNERLCRWDKLYRVYPDGREEDLRENCATGLL